MNNLAKFLLVCNASLDLNTNAHQLFQTLELKVEAQEIEGKTNSKLASNKVKRAKRNVITSIMDDTPTRNNKNFIGYKKRHL